MTASPAALLPPPPVRTAASGALAVDLRRVTKIYKRTVKALDGIDMQVRRGEIFGLLGPNGAGKSTLVKIMMSVVRPTHADGVVLDHPIGSKASLVRMGYLPEHHRFPRYLTGRQVLEFFAALSNIDRITRKKRAAELLETVGMAAWADKKISSYSKGMMQRVGVAQALVADPHLVILDEPTDGVDPVGRREIRDVLLQLKAQGRTVFVNSHLLSELEMICDRVAILVAGRLVSQGTLDELTTDRQCIEIGIESPDSQPAAVLLRRFATTQLSVTWPNGDKTAAKGALPSGIWIALDNATLRIGTTDLKAVQPILDGLRKEGLILRRLQQVRPSLEDLFIEAVGGMAGGHNAGASLAFPAAQSRAGGAA